MIMLRHEYLKCEEFSEFNHLIQTEDFLSRCIAISKGDVFDVLQSVLQSKTSLISTLCDAVIATSLKLRMETMSKADPLLAGGHLLRSLLRELDFSKALPLWKEGTVTSLHQPNHVALLTGTIRRIISRCVILSEIPDLKISAKVHPELAIIRLDTTLFETLLVDAIMVAIRNIRECTRRESHGENRHHSILVLCTPQLENKAALLGGKGKPNLSNAVPSKKRFFDIRRMELSVFDTSRSVNAHDQSSCTFGQKVIEELLLHCNDSREVGILSRTNRFGHFQRFSIQYQFSSDTVNASQFLLRRGDSAIYLTPLDRTALLEKYRRMRSQSHAAMTESGIRPHFRSLEYVTSRSSSGNKAILEAFFHVKVQYLHKEVRLDTSNVQLLDCVLIDSAVLDDESHSLTSRDIVLQLRLLGFRNVVAFLFKDEMQQVQLARELSDVAAIFDVSLVKPANTKSLKNLAAKCDEIIISDIFLRRQI